MASCAFRTGLTHDAVRAWQRPLLHQCRNRAHEQHEIVARAIVCTRPPHRVPRSNLVILARAPDSPIRQLTHADPTARILASSDPISRARFAETLLSSPSYPKTAPSSHRHRTKRPFERPPEDHHLGNKRPHIDRLTAHQKTAYQDTAHHKTASKPRRTERPTYHIRRDHTSRERAPKDRTPGD